MKKKKFYLISLLFIFFTLTSCNSRVNKEDSTKLKGLIENIPSFNKCIEYKCLKKHNNGIAYLKDDIYYLSLKKDDKELNYEYNLKTNDLYCDKKVVSNIKYDNLDEFSKAICQINDDECVTTNDYWEFVRSELLKATSLMVTTYRGEGYYYFFTIPAKEFISYEKYEFLKKGLYNVDFDEKSEIKVALKAYLQEDIIYPNFELSVNDNDIISFYGIDSYYKKK